MGLTPNESLLQLLAAVSPIDRGEYAAGGDGLATVFGGEVDACWKGSFDATEGVVARVGESLFFVSYTSDVGVHITRLDSLAGGLLTETFHDANPHHATSQIGTLVTSLEYAKDGRVIAMTCPEDWMRAAAAPVTELLREWAKTPLP